MLLHVSPRRIALTTACAAVAVPVLAGCSSSPGAAAVVGSQRITTQHLQQEVNAALANPKAAQQFGSDRAQFTREVLAHLITEDVVAAAAAAHHVSVTPADVTNETQTFVQQAGGSLATLQQQAAAGGVPTAELPAYIRDQALQQKLAGSLAQSLPATQAQLKAEYRKDIDQFDQVHAAHILVSSKPLAQRLLAQVKKNPSSFAALAAKYSSDTGSKSKGGDIGFFGRSQVVPQFASAAFGNPPGSFVLAHSQYGWHVIHVLEHKTVPFAQALPQLKQSLNASKVQGLMTQLLAQTSTKLGVHVNPRFGTWNAGKASVDPPASSVSSPAPSGSSPAAGSPSPSSSG